MAKRQIVDDMTEYISAVRSFLGKIVEATGNKSVSIGVSGGSAVEITSSALRQLYKNGQIARADVFFCDERLVPENDGDSIFGAYSNKKLDEFCTFHPVKTSSIDVDAAAKDYEDQIKKFFNVVSDDQIPQFDCLFLGMGEDGHTCSLFPGHDSSKEAKKFVTGITNSPKPPPVRVTLTYRVINAAKNVAFLVRGQGKAGVVKAIFSDAGSQFPAGLVQPKNGSTTWFLDSAAASQL